MTRMEVQSFVALVDPAGVKPVLLTHAALKLNAKSWRIPKGGLGWFDNFI